MPSDPEQPPSDGPRSIGPTAPRWTHVALPVGDLERSIEFYLAFTPLEVLERFHDDGGQSVWLCQGGDSEHPLVLVLVDFAATTGTPHPMLAPFAHLGIEMPTRQDVDELAARAERAGCLTMAPQQLPPPVGYVCMLSDPDGNTIELSYGQGVYAAFAGRFGPRPEVTDRAARPPDDAQ